MMMITPNSHLRKGGTHLRLLAPIYEIIMDNIDSNQLINSIILDCYM